MPETRFALFHAPGTQWRHDTPPFEQVGLHDHVAYFRLLHEAGKLAFGGPFVDAASGGMMVLAAGVGEEEATTIANGARRAARGAGASLAADLRVSVE